jgi:hypothetical protein
MSAVVTTIGINAAVNDGFNVAPGVNKSYTRTAAGDKAVFQTQDITTASWQAINFGLLATTDIVVLVNTDASNYVQLALDNAGVNIFARLRAGQVLPIPMDPGVTALYAKANTATCVLEVLASNL